MAKIAKQIPGPVNTPPVIPPDEKPFRFDIGIGLHVNMHSPVSESGDGKKLDGSLFYCPNTRDCLGMGLDLQQDHNNASDFYSSSDHSRFLLKVSQAKQEPLWLTNDGKEILTLFSTENLYTGFGSSQGAPTLELGSDIFSPNVVWKISGRHGLEINPYLRMMTAFPLHGEDAKNISLVGVNAGLALRYVFSDVATIPPPAGLSPLDIAFFMFDKTHNFFLTYGTARDLEGPADQAKEYTGELFGTGGGTPSARTEGLAALKGFQTFSGSREISEDLGLLLKSEGMETWLIGATIGATTLGFLLLSLDEKTAGLRAEAFVNTLTLGSYGMAIAQGFSKENALQFAFSRYLLNALAFSTGWIFKENEVGQELLSAGGQGMLSVSLTPDPTNSGFIRDRQSHYFSWEWNTMKGGSLFGYRQTTHTTGALYMTGALLIQAFPFSTPLSQEAIDMGTGRDALREADKAKVTAGFGWEIQTGPFLLGIGPEALILHTESGVVPGLGVAGQTLLSKPLNDDKDPARFEAGINISADITGDGFQLSFGPVIGARF